MRRAVALLALTACTQHIDPERVQSSIRAELAGKGVTMRTLSCPPGEKVEPGARFDCTGQDDDGETLVFHVTESDARGTVSWSLDGKILNLRTMGDALEAKVGQSADIQCPEKTVVMQVHHSVTCDVLVGGAKRQVLLTLANAAGHVDWRLLD